MSCGVLHEHHSRAVRQRMECLVNFNRHEETMEDYMGAEENWTEKLIVNAAPSLALLMLFAVQFLFC